MGIVFLVLSFEQIILPNGIELYPIDVKDFYLLIEFPPGTIPDYKQYETGILLKEFKNEEDLTFFLRDSIKEIHHNRNSFRFKLPLLNLIFGFYAPEKGFSSLKIFFSWEKRRDILEVIDTLPDTLVAAGYNIEELPPIKGFFALPSRKEGYYNLPPDIRGTGIIEFFLFMEILKIRGNKVVYSKTGRKTPFLIEGNPINILLSMKDTISQAEMEEARDRMLRFYNALLKNSLKRAVFLSLSGVNPKDFCIRWKDWIKIIDRNSIDRLREGYLSGGVLAISPSQIPILNFLLPNLFIDWNIQIP